MAKMQHYSVVGDKRRHHFYPKVTSEDTPLFFFGDQWKHNTFLLRWRVETHRFSSLGTRHKAPLFRPSPVQLVSVLACPSFVVFLYFRHFFAQICLELWQIHLFIDQHVDSTKTSSRLRCAAHAEAFRYLVKKTVYLWLVSLLTSLQCYYRLPRYFHTQFQKCVSCQLLLGTLLLCPHH